MTGKSLPTHSRLSTLESIDDQLIFGNRPLSEIADIAGKTPFYAYDRRLMTARVAELRRNLPDSVRIHYAMKANPMAGVVQHMASLIDGLDVASGGELEVALKTSVKPGQVSFAGPGKTLAEITSSIKAGIVINMESEREMERIAHLGETLEIRPNVAIGVNPGFELKTSGMKMGGGPTPFGVDAERVPKMLQDLRGLNLRFHGFHIFSGSQNLSYDAICESQRQTVELAIELSKSAPSPVLQLNIGGGFGIPYFPGDEPLDIGPIGENLHNLMPKVHDAMSKAELVVELGRFLVGEAGIYVCRVIDRKVSRGQVFLITDGGLHHHLAASGNFGQVIRKNYPVLVGNRLKGDKRERVSVVGPLCTPLDLLADRMEMARADVGDLVVVLQSGAYGLTASPTAFLSHPPPAEILL